MEINILLIVVTILGKQGTDYDITNEYETVAFNIRATDTQNNVIDWDGTQTHQHQILNICNISTHKPYSRNHLQKKYNIIVVDISSW